MNELNKFVVVGVLVIVGWSPMVSAYQAWNGTNVCCNGAVGKISDGCCGTNRSVVYNPGKNLCCGGIVQNIPVENRANYSCCSNGTNDESSAVAYNFYTSVCCNGDVIDKSPDKLDITYDCCGRRGKIMLYDVNTANCCDNRVVGNINKSCCGNKWTYDSTKQICANSQINGIQVFKVKTPPNNHSLACGLEIYDTLTEACCKDANGQNVVVPNSTGNLDPGCCLQLTEPFKISTYNYYNQVCCDSGVILAKQQGSVYDNIKCCNDHLYNASSHICCGNSTYTQNNDNPGVCCTGNYFKGKPNVAQICCNGSAYDQSPNDNNACCNDRILYNEKDSVCCGSKVAKRNNYTICCYSSNGTAEIINDFRTQECTDKGVGYQSVARANVFKKITDQCGPSFKPNVYDIV